MRYIILTIFALSLLGGGVAYAASNARYDWSWGESAVLLDATGTQTRVEWSFGEPAVVDEFVAVAPAGGGEPNTTDIIWFD